MIIVMMLAVGGVGGGGGDDVDGIDDNGACRHCMVGGSVTALTQS